MFYPHSNPRTIALGRFYRPATITPPTRADRKAEVSTLNLQTPDAGQKKITDVTQCQVTRMKLRRDQASQHKAASIEQFRDMSPVFWQLHYST